MNKIIFCDVDGVLNGNELDVTVGCGQIHKDKMDILNQALARTGAKVVLSSSWRDLVYRGEMNMIGLEWLFKSHGLMKGRLIGITNPDTTSQVWDGKPGTWKWTNERGSQITAYVKEHKIERYVVLDDHDLGISIEGHPSHQDRDAQRTSTLSLITDCEYPQCKLIRMFSSASRKKIERLQSKVLQQSCARQQDLEHLTRNTYYNVLRTSLTTH